MSKKVFIVSVLALVCVILASCNTYQRCPAYGSAEEISVTEPNNV